MRPFHLLPPLVLLTLLSAQVFTGPAIAQDTEQPGRLDLSRSRFDAPPERAASASALTLMFTGDSKLCGRTADQMRRHGADYPFALVAEQLRSADIAFGNCETAITDSQQQTPGKSSAAVKAGHAFVFKSDPAASGGVFASAGIDVLQLANNHAMDYCGEGLLDTIAALDDAGIAHMGAGADYGAAREPVVVERGGARVGFLAYSLIIPVHSAAGRDTPGINVLPSDYEAALARDIAALRGDCELAVVCFHWGVESTTVPTAQQRRIGRAAINAGADIVIGTHTHSMQGIEFYGGGLIAYSLGNFVFTGASSLLAGGILRIEAAPDPSDSRRMTITDASFLPCWIRDGRPEPSSDKRLRQQIETTMRATGTRLTAADDGWLELGPI